MDLMSKTSIPEPTRLLLWGKAAGRCQYDGCNKQLYIDGLTKYEFNSAYIAHIVADSENGPRGDKVRSQLLAKDINNLMLLCDEHHRLVDKIDVKGHPEERLLEMKQKHEQRLEILTAIQEDKRSNVILYGANIGQHNSSISWQKAAEAMIPLRYPTSSSAIELGLKNSVFKDNDEFYWKVEESHLESIFNERVKSRIATDSVGQYSVFGLAPQPLLIKLGSLLSDIPNCEIYQLHREPPNWIWQNNDDIFCYDVIKPEKSSKIVAINLSLSADIDDLRILNVLGHDVAIWTIKTVGANNDFLKSKEQLKLFRKEFRKLLNEIKLNNPECTYINIFPAVPVAIAIEIGRVWMPKADLPLKIYDENRCKGGFVYAIDIINK